MSNWRKHRFQDLVSLAERAAGGHMAFGPVTIQEGQHLETLLAEATQYREAHAHSQELRAKAEAEHDSYRAVLEGVDRWLTTVMNESNQHVYEPIAVAVTAALAEGGNEGAVVYERQPDGGWTTTFVEGRERTER